jgi:glycosyltransferase involved in cell wall biosynthesis
VLYVPRLPFTRFLWLTYANDYFCALVLSLFARLHGVDVLHCHGILPGRFALIAKNIGAYKVLTDVHGLLYEEAVYSGSLNPRSGLAKFYQRIELDTLRRTDGAVFVSSAMQKYFQERGVKTSYSTIIPCAVNPRPSLSSNCRSSVRQKHGLTGKFVLIYVGSAAPYQQVDKMCELFSAIFQKYPSAFFFILTYHVGIFRAELRRAGVAPEAYRIESVQHDHVFECLQAADIGFLLRDASPVNLVASPTKFGEYCSCGVPIITTASVGDVSQHVASNELGYIIDLNKLVDNGPLFAFIDDVLKNRADYFSRCTEFVRDQFSWQHYGAALSNSYRELGQR